MSPRPAICGPRALRIPLPGCSIPGWACAVGAVGDKIVGYAYGYPLPVGRSWWQKLRTPVDDPLTQADRVADAGLVYHGSARATVDAAVGLWRDDMRCRDLVVKSPFAGVVRPAVP
jgi:hypothetical protein